MFTPFALIIGISALFLTGDSGSKLGVGTYIDLSDKFLVTTDIFSDAVAVYDFYKVRNESCRYMPESKHVGVLNILDRVLTNSTLSTTNIYPSPNSRIHSDPPVVFPNSGDTCSNMKFFVYGAIFLYVGV